MPQLKPLTLRRNFSWTFIGNAVYAACQWGMLMVLAKLGSPEMVGQFTLGIAVTTPVIMFTNLQLRAVQFTDARQKYAFCDYLGLRLLGTGLALCAIALITIFANYRWETTLVILVIGVAKAFESLSDVLYGLIQQHERMDRIALSLMIKGPLSLLFLGFGVYLTHSVFWGAVGLAVAWALVLVGYDIKSGALILKNPTLNPYPEMAANMQTVAIKPRWHLRTLSNLTWTALPLGLALMLVSLYTNIPRYYIERYLGERELGVFAAISYLMVAGQMVVNALGESASPRLAKYYADGNSTAFGMLIFKLLGIGVLLGAGGVAVALVAGREILTILYRPEYAEYANLFVWVMVASGILYAEAFLSYGMTAARYFRIQIPLFSAVTGATVLACMWLIPSQGLMGAAMALIIGAIVRGIGTVAVIWYALSVLQRNLKAGQL